ncbi:hypothetical protein [Nocardia beijingensis]
MKHIRGPIRMSLAVLLGAMVAGGVVATAPSASAQQVWGACGISTPEDKVVATYSKGTLRCGNRGWGFRHVQGSHLNDWQRLADIEGRNWRDIADIAIAKSMDNPDVQRSVGSDRYCYSGQIYLVNKVRGTIETTAQPTVIVNTVTGNIVTAYPGGGCRA